MSVKPFEEHGHYTSVHDAVFDVVMPFCPPNAFKVLLFVLRKTRGWKKDEDVLRYAEIKKGTGIKSDATLAKELDWLLTKRLILARSEDGTPHEKGDRRAPAYSLNREFELRVEPPASLSENEVSKRPATSENEAGSTSENEASNNQSSQEPNEVESKASTSADSQKAAVPMGQYGMKELAERTEAARARGAKIHSTTDRERKDFGAQFKRAAQDGHEIDHLLFALDYMVAKAAGEIENEPKAWCGFRTALDRVLEGWRPKAFRKEEPRTPSNLMAYIANAERRRKAS